MSLASYSALKTAIVNFSGDNDANDPLLDDFIDLCETDMYGIWDTRTEKFVGLRLRSMESLATGTTSTSDQFMALPTGFLESRRLELALSGGNLKLDYVSPLNLVPKNSAGMPAYFTVTDQFEFDRTSDQAYTVNVQCYVKLTALSSSNTSNSILTSYPNVYLYGALMHLFRWARDGDEEMRYKQYFIDAIKAANHQDNMGRRGPAPGARMANRWSP